MRNWLTAQELAGLPGLPGTVPGIRKMAAREVWKSQKRAGTKAFEYAFSDLPAETQKALLSQAVAAGGGALLNKFIGGPETLKNIAVGKVLEEAAGVTSVFVTNWPSGGMPGVSVPDISVGKKPGSFRLPSGVTGGLSAIAARGAMAAPLAGAAGAGVVVGGSSENTDEGRLRAAENSKLLTGDQRTYYAAFYRNRINLAQASPDAADDWISSQAQKLAQQQTGLTASGGTVADGNAWAQRIALAGLSQPAQGLALLQASQPGPRQAGAAIWGESAAQLAAPVGSPAMVPWAEQALGRLGSSASMLPSGGPGQTAGGQDGAMLRELSEVLRQQISQLQGLVGMPLVVEVRSDSNSIFADVERRVGIQARRG